MNTQLRMIIQSINHTVSRIFWVTGVNILVLVNFWVDGNVTWKPGDDQGIPQLENLLLGGPIAATLGTAEPVWMVVPVGMGKFDPW